MRERRSRITAVIASDPLIAGNMVTRYVLTSIFVFFKTLYNIGPKMAGEANIHVAAIPVAPQREPRRKAIGIRTAAPTVTRITNPASPIAVRRLGRIVVIDRAATKIPSSRSGPIASFHLGPRRTGIRESADNERPILAGIVTKDSSSVSRSKYRRSSALSSWTAEK